MSTISAFKAQMRSGGARPNQFRVIMTFPANLVQNSGLAGQKAEFMVKAASIPSFTLSNIPVMYRGRPVNMAGEREFEPWQVQVYNDGDFALRNAFEQWVQGISAAEATTGVLLPGAYQVDMEVHQLDRNDAVLKKYRFYDAYPTQVGAMALDWDANNSIQQYDVVFQYNWNEAIS